MFLLVPLAVSGVQTRTILIEGESSEIAFRVHERSYPISWRWLYNEAPFSGSGAVQLLSKPGALRVLHASAAIEGSYTLVLTSSYQTIQVSTTIEVICKYMCTTEYGGVQCINIINKQCNTVTINSAIQ